VPSEVSAFINEHRVRFGVEPICGVLGVSASAFNQRASGQRCARSVEDERLLEPIREIHARNYFAYGSWRMWRALRRAGEDVGRGRVERLMRRSIQGAKRRGKPWRTTITDPKAARRPVWVPKTQINAKSSVWPAVALPELTRILSRFCSRLSWSQLV
jgi:putative transposase